MKTRHLCLLASVLSVTFVSAQAPWSEADPDVQLKAAMNIELVKGDLGAAIAEYKRIAAGPDTSRAVAARALLQLAQSYEKLGDSEARTTYERIARDYADQRPIVDQARARVAAFAQATVAARAPAKRLLVDHRDGAYGKVTRDGKSYLRYNPQQRAFELLDFATGRVRRLATEGPSPGDGTVDVAQLSNDGRRIAATVHVYRPGTETQDPRPVDRAELRVFDVGGRGGGRVLASWPRDQLGRFTARAFAWSPRNDLIWLKVMFRDNSAQIVTVDLSAARRVVKTMTWHDHSQPPSLSPDGRFITYHDSFDRQAPPDIVILASDGSGEQRLEHPANDNKPMFMPDGSGIVFESNRRGDRDLWFIPVAEGRPSGAARLVWRSVGAFGQVERFADNGALSYYFASNDYAVYTVPVDLDGGRAVVGERTPIAPVQGEMNTGAAFSPDGRELLFFRARGRRIALREIATGREREIPLPSELGLYAIADWCAGSDRAIVSGYAPGIGNVTYSIELRDATVRRVTADNASSILCLNPQELVYLRSNSGAQPTTSIVRRALDGGSESVLWTAPAFPCGCVRSISRSPDGTRIAFVIHEPTGSRVVTIAATGGPASDPLMTAGAAIDGGQVPLIQHVAWMPDGKRLLVVRVDEEFAGATGQTQRPLWLWEVPVDGSAARRIGLLPVSKVEGYFPGIFNLTVRADGRQIAYQSHEGYLEQTWAIENLAQSILASSR